MNREEYFKDIIFKNVTSHSLSEDLKISIIEQGLEGWLPEEFPLKSKSIHIRNLAYLHWSKKIATTALDNKWKVIALKGIVLLEKIYDDISHRTLGDIDLLVEKDNLNEVMNWLRGQGFEDVKEPKWWGNDFKYCLSKEESGIEIVIELHSRLFINEKSIKWDSIPFYNEYYRMLNYSDMLIHLMGHLAYQHTFLKIHWLIDINLFISKHAKNIDWIRVAHLSKHLNHDHSSHSINIALVNIFGTGFTKFYKKSFLRRIIFTRILTWKFLTSPTTYKTRYYLLKHATMDSWIGSIKYDFGWLWHKILIKLKKNF